MSIFNIEIDFVKDNERLARISRISNIVLYSCMSISTLIIMAVILINISSLPQIPLYLIFITLSMGILVSTSVYFHNLTIRYNSLSQESVKATAKAEIKKKVSKILIPVVVTILIMAAISFILPSYRNYEYNLTQNETVTLSESSIFQSGSIFGIWVSGNGITIIQSNDGMSLIINDSLINPSNEILLYQGKGYTIYQEKGDSRVIAQYQGNFMPYYFAILIEILSALPLIIYTTKYRR